MSGWVKPLAVHDPAKVVLDLALTLALGGDCLADIALPRSKPRLYRLVASDATVSRTISTLAADAPAALAAIDTARAADRARAWKLAGAHAPNHGASSAAQLIVDLDATPVGSRSEKEQAAPTHKKGFGLHPLFSFVDHGAAGTGEPLSVLLRPRQRRFQHRHRPHHGHQGRPGSAAHPPPGPPCGPQGADPHR
jgi:Transposase DDE domain group 1